MNFKEKPFWRFAYKVYPPFLRVLEKVRFHSERQDFLVGHLHSDYSHTEFALHLESHDYEPAILAWMDPGEKLSHRKIHEDVFQYHIRLFADGEIRCHYEYASEANPWGHVRETIFEPRHDYFRELLKEFLR